MGSALLSLNKPTCSTKFPYFLLSQQRLTAGVYLGIQGMVLPSLLTELLNLVTELLNLLTELLNLHMVLLSLLILHLNQQDTQPQPTLPPLSLLILLLLLSQSSSLLGSSFSSQPM